MINDTQIGKTSLRLCEIAVFVGAAITCLSCLFGREVFTFFNNLSPFTAFILILPIAFVLRKSIFKRKLELFAILAFAIISVVASLFISGLYISHALTAIVGVLVLYIMSFLTVDKDFQIAIIMFLSIMSICLFFLSIDFSQLTLVEKFKSVNTNVMGIVALLVNSYLMILLSINKVTEKFSHLKVLVAIFGYITITVYACRSAQLAFLVFLIIAYFFPTIFWGKKRTRSVLLLAMVAGLIFPIIYIQMFENGMDDISFPLVDKGWFSGREVLWQSGSEWLSETPTGIFHGIGPNFASISKDFNYHNSYLSILFNFGLPAFMAYYFSVFKSAERSILTNDDKKLRALQIALIVMIMVVSLVETTFPATTFIWFYGICFIPLVKQEN